jgi:hypothetical protein
VNRSNTRIFKQRQLPQDVLRTRIHFKPFGNGTGNSFPHFGGSRICESHYKQPVYIDRVIRIRDFMNNPFNKNRCLPRSRCRRNQHAEALLGYRFLLFFRPISAAAH